MSQVKEQLEEDEVPGMDRGFSVINGEVQEGARGRISTDNNIIAPPSPVAEHPRVQEISKIFASHNYCRRSVGGVFLVGKEERNTTKVANKKT